MTLPNDLLLNQALRAGSIAFQAGNWPEAVRNGRTATALAPGHAGAHNLLGLALLQSGEIQSAIVELAQAASREKNNPSLLGNLGQAYAMAGRHADAYETFRRAQRIAPAQWQFTQGAAIALAQQGKPSEAEPILRRLTERYPQEAAPWNNLGNVQLELGKLEDAENCYRNALRLDPNDLDVRLSLGSALHRQSKFDAAESTYRECIAAQPEWIAPRLNLVSALIDDGRFGDAETECRQLIMMAPELTEAHRFLGAAIGHQGRQLEALDAFRQAAQYAPDDAAAQRSFGGALAESGRLHEALRVLVLAERIEPDTEALPQLRSMFELTHGLFSDGWSDYRFRPSYLLLSKKWANPRISQQLPDNLEGMHILVRREQGLGDELFFLRQLPLLKARGAKISVYASAKIAAMIDRAGIADAVFPDSEAAPVTADLEIFCGDLPHALHDRPNSPIPWLNQPSTLRDFPIRIGAYYPAPVSSLRIPALTDALARMHQRLHALGQPPYVGITWRAGTVAREQRGENWVLSKEIPIPSLGATLRHTPGTLIALQRHPDAGELEALASACGRTVADLTDCNESLEDMLALLEIIDDYVGVSNTNMHLRAATGRSARVLVPSPPEWRWMLNGAHSPWFPAFRVYRQSAQGQWTDALEQLGRDLARLSPAV